MIINNVGDYKSHLVLTCLFIVCPFLSLPLIFLEIYNGKRYPLLLLAIFMGLLSMFYFPWGDQYSYYNDLDLCKYLDFEDKFDFTSIMIVREFNFINLLIFFSSKIGVNLEILRFILTFICSTFVFSIFVGIERLGLLPQNKNYRFSLFIMIWLSVPYYLINYGFRTGFGASSLVLGVYFMYINNKPLRGFLCYLLAAFTHYLFIAYAIVFIIVYYYDGHLSGKKTFLISIIMYFSAMAMFTMLYGYVPFLDTLMNFYVYSDKYGAGSYDWSSSASKELWINGVLNTTVLFWYFFRLRNKGRYENLIYLLFILCAFSLTFAVIFQRTVRSLIPTLVLYLVLQHNRVIIFKARNVIVFVLSLAFVYPFILHRDIYQYAHIEKIIYYPLPLLIFNHYDSNTIHLKVDNDGSYIH